MTKLSEPEAEALARSLTDRIFEMVRERYTRRDVAEAVSAALVELRSAETDEETIEILAEEPDSRIRLKVATNPAAPVHVLEELAKDVDPAVRLLVAASRHTPIAVLRMQLYDMNPYVKRMAIHSLTKFKIRVRVRSHSSLSSSASQMQVGACS